MATAAAVRRLEGHSGRINAAAFGGADGDVVFTASYDQTVKAWDLRSHSRVPVQTLDAHRDSVTSVDVGPHAVLTGCVDGSCRAFDLRAGRLHTDARGGPVTSARFYAGAKGAPAKAYVAVCTDGRAVLVDAASGAALQTYAGAHEHRGGYALEACAAFDGEHVLCGSEDGSVAAYAVVGKGKGQGQGQGRAGKAPDHRLAGGHRPGSAVSGISPHPDAGKFLTSGHDGECVLWERAVGSLAY